MGIAIKRYIGILSLFFVLILSYVLARITSLVLTGYFPEKNVFVISQSNSTDTLNSQNRLQSVDAIIKRNFFDAQDSSFDQALPPVAETEDSADALSPVQTSGVATKTTLPISLVSTIAFGSGEDKMSSCVLEASGKSTVYSVGESLSFPQTQIVRILPKRVEFSNKGRLEFVEINLEDKIKPSSDSSVEVKSLASEEIPSEPKPEDGAEVADETGGVEQDGNHFRVKASLVQEALSQPDKLYTQARAQPYTENGKNAGFKFLKVTPKSLFHQLGIRKGDVVKAVNGKTLDMQSGMQTFSELKNLKNFEMDIVRRGSEQKYTYEVVE